MQQLEDITKISGGSVPIVDCVIGGSPCQDLSVAGKRAGLAGERSGLFMEQVRVIKEMREHDRTSERTGESVRPRFMVWENVVGAFSSNKAEDFRIVLEETAKIADEAAVIPRPPKDKWTNAGCVLGDGWSIAWRVLDAQFWGVPQRRRRIALVADFGGGCAPEILFERESVSGNIKESGETGQSASGGIETGTQSSGTRDEAETFCIAGNIIGRSLQAGGNGAGFQKNIAYTLTSTDCHAICQTNLDNKEPVAFHLTQDPVSSVGRTPCLSAGSSKNGQAVVGVIQNIESDCLYPDVCGTLCASGAGTSRPAGQCNETDLCIVQAVDCRNLRTTEICGTLQSKENGGYSLNYINPVMCMAHSMPHAEICEELSPTLTCHHEQPFIGLKTVVRRLTPLECERLQGYPDGWTDIGEWTDSKSKVHKTSDSARYKVLGNSIALPPWTWVLKRLCSCYDRTPTMASLFDGIGGFPLIWERINGTGSCLWASEIEEFPIAVTKKRFDNDSPKEKEQHKSNTVNPISQERRNESDRKESMQLLW